MLQLAIALQGVSLIPPWYVSGRLIWPDLKALIYQLSGMEHDISVACIRDIPGWYEQDTGCDIALVSAWYGL